MNHDFVGRQAHTIAAHELSYSVSQIACIVTDMLQQAIKMLAAACFLIGEEKGLEKRSLARDLFKESVRTRPVISGSLLQWQVGPCYSDKWVPLKW